MGEETQRRARSYQRRRTEELWPCWFLCRPR